MHDLSPLDGWQPRFAALAARELALRMREVPFMSQVLLRIHPQGPAAERIEAALKSRLPRRFGEYSRSGDIDTCWLGPDEWLLIAPAGRAAVISDAIESAAGNDHHLVLDVSANRTCVELSGADTRYVLAKGTHEDVAQVTFAGQRVVQTVLAKVPVILQLHSEETFRVFVRNSFASYLAQWLMDAAAEIVSARRHGVDGLRESSL